MSDVDISLAEQLHSAKRRLKSVRRLKRMFKHEQDLLLIEQQILLSIKYYESMIQNKEYIKMAKTVNKTVDILTKGYIIDMYKYGLFIYLYSYNMMLNNLLFLFKKDKE